MDQIKLILQRLDEADNLPSVLGASWEIFELIVIIASTSVGESPDMYPAFTFARGAAVSGRNALAFAPSLSPVPANATLNPPKPTDDVYETADALADLASALCVRLRASAELAVDLADRSACENAAAEAERITRLLAKGN
jgi:hypothetical protein